MTHIVPEFHHKDEAHGVNMRRHSIILFLALLSGLWLSGRLLTFPALSEGAVVRAVLFYSPTCPHCHQVIEEALPPLFDQYGEQLELVGIDTTTQEGAELFQAAIQRFEIPPESQAVPMLIIDETILLGSLDIPEQFPGLIEAYLAQGGIDWPDIPGLKETIAAAKPEPTVTPAPSPATGAASQAGSVETAAAPEATQEVILEPSPTAAASGLILPGDPNPGVGERFQRDLAGNSLAVAVLLGMLVSIAATFRKLRPAAAVAWMTRPSIWIPVLCLAGMVVAGYLAYVETAQVEAVCGPVGDCNTVQQSEYARLFGVLPIGVLGLAGYVAILAAWLVGRYGPQRQASLASLGLLGMAFSGVAFSVYLTFLEPFVIGATCAWCLTSSVIMTLLLWLSIAPGQSALSYSIYGEEHAYRKTGYRDPVSSK